ncbi:16S rRNA (guanine(527)-N(7))-methyltransferase RsmG [Rhizobium sp. CFBP 8762]|uniref:16S rRNA (guanine(527)-N(7))-methyltransferase RsmG n=1 Tax=Rhizobium sp. CFBP 8762 TaxID=2775279 RepID=UPI00177E71C6|nr:16S rRNA (guanine(527)-N(7))-methyltransferase RsmG [Rhizobium sp. CFBP 8762]MBD8556751.1 16S rRNA (guanine(527)-N(7))-methyltransferase RsmG [Rhizobium sp. CFBP 8762]
MRMNDLRVSRETAERLEIYARLFNKWSSSINLTSSSTIQDFWDRHVKDSLQIYRLRSGPVQWADFGSGAGFPGLVTAICLTESHDGWVHLIESNNKKAAFLRTVIGETGARAHVSSERIEAVTSRLLGIKAISARALADLNQLLEYSYPLMRDRNVRAYFHKGRDYQTEIDNARMRWQFDLIQHQSTVERDSVVLEIHNLALNS